MKRELKEPKERCKKITPFLWRKCCLCNKEYRKEPVYRIKSQNVCNPVGQIDYNIKFVCSHCAESNQDAVEKLDNYMQEIRDRARDSHRSMRVFRMKGCSYDTK